MATVTIEGSATPSVILPRGQRRTVQLTARVQRLIDRGFVTIVDDNPEVAPTPAPWGRGGVLPPRPADDGIASPNALLPHMITAEPTPHDPADGADEEGEHDTDEGDDSEDDSAEES